MSHWDAVKELKLDLSGIDINKDVEDILKGLSWEEIQEIDKALKAIQESYTARERVIASTFEVLKFLLKTGATLI